MIQATELFHANNCDAHSPDCFFNGAIIWYPVRLNARNVIASCCPSSVVPGDVTVANAYFICSVGDIICSFYLSDPPLR